MEPELTVLDSLRKAVEAMPEDVPLRLHLATMLLQAGQRDEAVRQIGAVLQRDPGNAKALGMLRDSGPEPAAAAGQPPADPPVISAERPGVPAPPPLGASQPDAGPGSHPGETGKTSHYDWSQAEDELRDVLPSMFVGDGDAADSASAGIDEADAYDAEQAGLTLADVIDMFVGQSERNIHELFEVARRNAPCVLFLDEVDAIGQKRSQLRHTPMRSAVNQLLLELDDVSGNNEGVFLLAATNHPWDVDSALRRPGRFDRTLLVLPPDAGAREGVFRYHLKNRPVAGIDLAKLARQTDGYSGADIAHICETAAERALMDSVRRGEPRMIGTPDLEAAIAEVKPSLGAWFDVARNVALFANEGGTYDDLAAYLRKRRLI